MQDQGRSEEERLFQLQSVIDQASAQNLSERHQNGTAMLEALRMALGLSVTGETTEAASHSENMIEQLDFAGARVSSPVSSPAASHDGDGVPGVFSRVNRSTLLRVGTPVGTPALRLL